LNVQCSEVIVASGIRTVHAACAGVRVEKVARSLLEEASSVARASLTRWCIELSRFCGGALDWLAV
jgi:hypothetical protein